ncbi:helix-turn-helix transcriptional regulator [Tardiphaga sp.]|uniref:helix-turn-helix transcriptional regulator n=1 Tax=Tardiphaga sp. TaxID=1926292 RepID=UPI002607C5D0|nr:helix-turn-helix transcriptional regulator [Tardiphaga sp.]MDB5620493.1 transcriptional regulator [Tardiphaga sp.]
MSPLPEINSLGAYLKNRRTKLDPTSFGVGGGRRRTLGLRREEVAQRANISTTWYTWLEQGRGGRASADVLDRIARALTLTDIEREHLFLLGLGRPPAVHYRGSDAITPRLQRLLDVLSYSPAIVRTPTWDVVAWNRAAAAVFTDYGTLPPDQRNILRMIFCDPNSRTKQSDWQSVARFVVSSFRIDAARAGADAEVTRLVEELSEASPDFAMMWRDNNVQTHGDGVKQLRHPLLGPITLEYSAFAVDGRPDLSLIVYNPATAADRSLIESLVEGQPAPISA